MNFNFGNVTLGLLFVTIILVILFIFFRGFLKKNMPKDSQLRFCPKCGGQNINIFRWGFLSGPYGLATPPQYHCNDCNYDSGLFPVAESKEELKKIQDKIRKKRK